MRFPGDILNPANDRAALSEYAVALGQFQGVILCANETEMGNAVRKPRSEKYAQVVLAEAGDPICSIPEDVGSLG
jgi:hypothetical protein